MSRIMLLADVNDLKVKSDKEPLPELIESMKKQGFLKEYAVYIDNEGNVFLGNRRVKAAKMAGIAMVPCVVFDAIERLPLSVASKSPRTYASSEELAEALKESWDLPEE